MADERLTLRYVPLSSLELWSENPKVHNLDQLEESFRRYGFRDPPAWDPKLNGGQGGIAEGNGRTTVLRRMQAAGQDPPRGIAIDEGGGWAVPVLFGIEAATEATARGYALDHNLLSMTAGGLGVEDLLQVFDEEALRQILESSPDVAELLVGFSSDDLDALLTGPAFEQLDGDQQPKLDRKKIATCPECGHEFTP